MGLIRWIVIVTLIGCGSVLPGGDDEPPIDAPTCDACFANGASCTADTDCLSNECTCNDAGCTAKVCAATACACGFTTDGSTCTGEISAGVADRTCPAGCDGTGACEQPVLWFKFDDVVAGTLPINSGTWPGTLTRFGGSLGGLSGQVGTAVGFSQSTDGLVISDPADGSLDNFASWTVEAWVNFAVLTDGTNITFAKKEDGYLCRGVASGGQFFHQAILFTPSQQPVNSVMVLPTLNTWYHAACTFDGNTLKLYWNGGLVGTALVSGLTNDTGDALGIGQSSNDSENLNGMMDDFRMWSTPRTDRQICIAACGSFVAGACTFDSVCGN